MKERGKGKREVCKRRKKGVRGERGKKAGKERGGCGREEDREK